MATSSDSGSFINYFHFKTIPGILNLVELVFGIICIAAGSPAPRPGTHFFLFVAYVNLIITCFWIVGILFRIQSKIRLGKLEWPAVETFYPGIAFLTYLVGTIVQFSAFTNLVWIGWNPKPRSYTAGVFGILNSIAYAASTFYGYKAWKYPTSASQIPA